MAKRVQRRRGTTVDHSTFTGEEGELTVDITVDTVVVHDGITVGGHPLSRADGSNLNLLNSIGVPELNLSDGNTGYVLQTDGAGTISFTNVPDVSGSSVGGDLSGTVGNAQIVSGSVGIPELNLSDGNAGQVLSTDGAGTISFTSQTDVSASAIGGDLSGTIGNAQIVANTIGVAELNVAADGSSGQVLATNGTGDFFFTTNTGSMGASSSTFVENNFAGDDVTTVFTLSLPVLIEESILVFIDGVAQPTASYNLPTTTTIDFISSPPATDSDIRVLHLGIASEILDNTINGAKIAMGADVTGDMIYFNGTDYRRLGIGTAGQHLAVNSGTSAPEWVNSVTVGGGQVLQTQFVNKSDIFEATVNFNAYQDVPGLTKTITPSLATSKIFLSGTVMASINTKTLCVRIMRSINSGAFVEVGSGDTAGVRNTAHSSILMSGGSVGPDPMSIHFVDSPNTLSSVEYKLQLKDDADIGQWWINSPINNPNAATSSVRTNSGFTLQELS